MTVEEARRVDAMFTEAMKDDSFCLCQDDYETWERAKEVVRVEEYARRKLIEVAQKDPEVRKRMEAGAACLRIEISSLERIIAEKTEEVERLEFVLREVKKLQSDA